MPGKCVLLDTTHANAFYRIEFEDGTAIDYSGVGAEVWRKLSTSGSAWSYYRDNIEEEFSGRRGRVRLKENPSRLRIFSKLPGNDADNM